MKTVKETRRIYDLDKRSKIQQGCRVEMAITLMEKLRSDRPNRIIRNFYANLLIDGKDSWDDMCALGIRSRETSS